MADSRLSALAAITGANLATGDLFEMVDVSDTSMDATGTNKQMTAAEVAAGMFQAGVTSREDGYMGTTGALAAPYSRYVASSNGLGPLSTGRLLMLLIGLPAGILVSNIALFSGTTAAATSTNCWAAFFDSSRNLLAISADDTSASPWAASTKKTFAMTTPYRTTAAGAYYVGVMVKATTVPTLEGVSGNTTGLGNVTPIVAGLASNTGLTNPASCPNPAGALSSVAAKPYFEIS